MMDFETALEDADILIYMLEIGEKQMKDEQLFEKIQRLSIPVIVLINKIDTADQTQLVASVEHWQVAILKSQGFPYFRYHRFFSSRGVGLFNFLITSHPTFQKIK